MKAIDNINDGIQKAKTFNYNINLTQLILGVLILLILGIGGWKLSQNKVDKLEDKLATEIKLKNALLDSTRYYQNKEKEWVAEKLTIQGSIKTLEKNNAQLSQDQRDLINRVKELNKTNTVIAAALIKMQVKIDSLLLDGEVTIDTTKKTVSFADKYVLDKKVMKYDFTIGKVIPATVGVKPTLFITTLEFPNTQTVDFHWKDNKRAGYPVAFSVSNTNDFFKTVNIESYAIPELTLPDVKPTGWQKVGKFFKSTGNKLVYVGIGAAIGIGTFMIIAH